MERKEMIQELARSKKGARYNALKDYLETLGDEDVKNIHRENSIEVYTKEEYLDLIKASCTVMGELDVESYEESVAEMDNYKHKGLYILRSL